jgi:hypothetical protein
MVFLDINIFLYVVSRAEADQSPNQTAQRLNFSHGQNYDGVRIVNPFL